MPLNLLQVWETDETDEVHSSAETDITASSSSINLFACAAELPTVMQPWCCNTYLCLTGPMLPKNDYSTERH